MCTWKCDQKYPDSVSWKYCQGKQREICFKERFNAVAFALAAEEGTYLVILGCNNQLYLFTVGDNFYLLANMLDSVPTTGTHQGAIKNLIFAAEETS